MLVTFYGGVITLLAVSAVKQFLSPSSTTPACFIHRLEALAFRENYVHVVTSCRHPNTIYQRIIGRVQMALML